MATPGAVCTVLEADAYQRALGTWGERGQHREQVVDCVQRHVLPQLLAASASAGAGAGPPTCLDVGAGDCAIARRLAAAGFAVTAVEANGGYFTGAGAGPGGTAESSLQHGEQPSGPACEAGTGESGRGGGSLELRVGDFLDPSLGLVGRQFDLVMAIHVLYQPPAVRQRLLDALLGAGRPGGFLLVMLSSPRGAMYEFNDSLSPGANTQSDDVARALVRRGLPFQVFPAPNLTPLDSADDVAAILKFVALENCGMHAPEPGRLEAAVAGFLQRIPCSPAGGGYLLTQDSDLILACKGAPTD